MINLICGLLQDAAILKMPELQEWLVRYVERNVTMMGEQCKDLVNMTCRMQINIV